MGRQMSHKAPPMTRFYTDNAVPDAVPLNPADFPPPPPFIFQLKDLSRQIQSKQNFAREVPSNHSVQSKPNSFELPPPPPELMVQAAKSYKMPPGMNSTLRARPPPPRR